MQEQSVRSFLKLISGFHHRRIRRGEEAAIQVHQLFSFLTVAFDKIVFAKVHELYVEGSFLGIEKWPAFATDAETIFHRLIASDRDEREVIPAVLVIEITKVIQIEVIQPMESGSITGPYSQDHRSLERPLRNGESNVPCIASEREHCF